MVAESRIPPKEELPPDIAEVVDEADDPELGFYGPGSAMWKVARENAVLLAGVAAALLQVAHPKVAAGVEEHSDYESDTFGRFRRTFEIVDAITFADAPSAVEASLEVRDIHREVVGELPDDVGRFDEGDGYYANDPELLLWVNATLVEQALAGYTTYVGELSQREQEAYYEDTKIFGRMMGIPSDILPEDLDAFYDYYRETIEEDIAVGEEGMRIKETLFNQYRPLRPFLGLVAGGTLPAKARVEFGIDWGPARRRAFERFAHTARATVHRLPDAVRYNSEYRESVRRLGLEPVEDGERERERERRYTLASLREVAVRRMLERLRSV